MAPSFIFEAIDCWTDVEHLKHVYSQICHTCFTDKLFVTDGFEHMFFCSYWNWWFKNHAGQWSRYWKEEFWKTYWVYFSILKWCRHFVYICMVVIPWFLHVLGVCFEISQCPNGFSQILQLWPEISVINQQANPIYGFWSPRRNTHKNHLCK